jgi:hypothetical protein
MRCHVFRFEVTPTELAQANLRPEAKFWSVVGVLIVVAFAFGGWMRIHSGQLYIEILHARHRRAKVVMATQSRRGAEGRTVGGSQSNRDSNEANGTQELADASHRRGASGPWGPLGMGLV